jgi:glycopeptide antibiotics resistance protein
MVPRVFYPLLPYRSFASPILVLWSIVVPFWLVFRLNRLRTPGRRRSFLREILLLVFVLYLSALASVTLSPNHPSRRVAETSVGIELRPSVAALTCSSATLPPGSTARGFCVRNAQGNFMLFFPLGILLPLLWRRLRFWRAVQIAIALSLSIEIIQYVSGAWGSYRTVDVNDVILNVLGASLGLVFVSLLRLGRSARPEQIN